jgi:hypothetical protein
VVDKETTLVTKFIGGLIAPIQKDLEMFQICSLDELVAKQN